DQRGCFKRVTGPFLAQITCGLAAQFLVNDRHQLVERFLIAAPIADEQFSDVLRLRHYEEHRGVSRKGAKRTQSRKEDAKPQRRIDLVFLCVLFAPLRETSLSPV